MAKPSGAIIEIPIKANFREGLSALEYFVSTHGARKGLADTALKTANSGYLTRRLVDVAQDVTVHEEDCGTIDGIEMENLIKAGEIIQPLGDRILGRVALEDVLDPITGEALVPSGTEITESSVRKIDEAGISKVSIRSVLTCRTPHGVCAKCYGRDLAKGHLVAMGEAIGIIAAESIGEPGTQLTMRTFHIGGIASGKTEQAEIYTKGGGVVKLDRLNVVRNSEGRLVVLNRNGEIVIVGPDIEKERAKVEKGSEILVKDGQSVKINEIIAKLNTAASSSSKNNPEKELFISKLDGIIKYENIECETDSSGRQIVSNDEGKLLIVVSGRERERYPIIYGAELLVEEGQNIKVGEKIAVWDAFTTPVLTDVSGRIKYGDLIENTTFQEKVDIITGRSSKVVIQSKSSEYSPRISIRDEHGKNLKLPSGKGDASYQLPVNAIIMVDEKDHSGKDITVQAGQVIAKIPRETTKIKDITGGLPRVAELFEVRKPKEYALISEIDGTVSFDNNEQKIKGKRKIKVTPEFGDPKEYQIQRGKHINVRDGDYIRAGEPLMDGDVNPHDILRIKGIKALAQFLVNEIQEVYRIQGVKINDKHIETIVRQMVRRVKITEVNDSVFMQGEQVERRRFEDENQRVLELGGMPAVAESQLLGITRAALTTESFISAASFQETTKVLTDASIFGRTDHLRGLKENVIMGRLIHAGSGRAFYEKSLEIGVMN
jgi:DNA-directed RNA polymerase subunit beta'